MIIAIAIVINMILAMIIGLWLGTDDVDRAAMVLISLASSVITYSLCTQVA